MTAPFDTAPTTVPAVALEVTGPAKAEVTDRDLELVEQTIDKTLGMLSEPVTSVNALVSTHPTNDPAHVRRLRATIVLRGEVVRAETWAASVAEAVERLGEKLRHQVDARTDRRRHDPHGREAAPGQWRHGNLPTARPSFFDRPTGEREIVRQVSLATEAPSTLEEAQWDRFQLGYDFFLFHDADLGDGAGDTLLLGDDQVLRAADARTLSVDGAREWLDAVGDELVFFVDEATGRGAVLYRRYDGHYGLVTAC